MFLTLSGTGCPSSSFNERPTPWMALRHNAKKKTKKKMSQFFSNQFSHQENIPPDHPSVSAYLLSEGYGGKIYDHIINNTD